MKKRLNRVTVLTSLYCPCKCKHLWIKLTALLTLTNDLKFHLNTQSITSDKKNQHNTHPKLDWPQILICKQCQAAQTPAPDTIIFLEHTQLQTPWNIHVAIPKEINFYSHFQKSNTFSLVHIGLEAFIFDIFQICVMSTFNSSKNICILSHQINM